MKALTKITFTDDNGIKFFGEGPCRLLCLVEETGSLRAAAKEMEMAYSKASKLLKQAETSLGFPLTTRSTGGKDGGGSVLTEEGKQFLKQYQDYRDACIRANEQLYREMFPKTGCVIMASGMGKRFGSNKLMADFLGEPLICRAFAATEGLFDKRVVVTRHEEIAGLCRQREIPCVLHDLPYRSDTVRLGLEALGDVQACLFCPGDQPLLKKETVAALLGHWRENREQICRPIAAEAPGAPVLFPQWAFSELKDLPQGKGGGYSLARHPEKVSCLPVEDPLELTDADTPETLSRLLCEVQKNNLNDPE